MKKKYLNTLVALALLAALWGSFTYYDKRKSREASKIESSPQEKILALDSAHIQSFTLKPRSGEAVTCRKEGTNWSIVEPRKLPADPSTVSSFLSSLTSATVEEVVDAKPASPKDFGLDSPAHTVEVSSDSKPAKFTLLLGDETPTSGGVYAQVGGSPRVVTLASYLKSSLEKNLFDLRDKRAVTLDVDRLQKIEVESKGKRWRLAKNPEGVWDLVLPPPVRADHFAVDGMVNQLRNLSMQSIVAEDKKKSAPYGFGAPALQVKLSSPAGNQTIVLGKKDGQNYDAMNSALDAIFTLSSDFLTQFQKDPADLRDKDLFSFSTFEAKRVEVDTPKGHRVFEKQKDKWKQTVPAAKDETTEKLDTLLDRLHALRADSFPKGENLGAFGLTKPAYKFQVQFGEKSQNETVEAAKVGDHVYARRPTDPLPSELSKTALDDIEKSLNEL
jgi:uncharacterized protein DUF4340